MKRKRPAATPSSPSPPTPTPPSRQRVVAYFDVDCFYAQAEEVRDPARLRGKPIAITQKFLCVTSNYAARAMGVTKLMPIKEAKRVAAAAGGPHALVLIPGEDLTPYRDSSDAMLFELRSAVRAEEARYKALLPNGGAASAAASSAASNWLTGAAAAAAAEATGGGAVERGGLDEFVLDITALSKLEVQLERGGQAARGWASDANVHLASRGAISADAEAGRAQTHRPQDLRAGTSAGAGGGAAARRGGARPPADADETLLAAGTRVASRIKAALKRNTGFTTSVGVAHNRLLAKLCGGLDKPDGLTW